MKVIAVVVTYNRLALLKECVAALQTQTRKPDALLIVNNDSTDGTTEWLQKQSDLKTILQPNRGGAWGFYTAIKEGYNLGADWVWVMDDDTVASATALEELATAIHQTENEPDAFGFMCSKVLWTDGSIHNANTVVPDTIHQWKQSYEHYFEKGIELVPNCTFVSAIVSRKAVQKVGLPLKEMFIWYDDIEFTRRITNNGFAGALVSSSIVVHKTPDNHTNDLFTDDASKIWKHRHGMRNQLYFRRYTKGYGSYLRNVVKRMTVLSVQMLTKRKTDRWAYAKMVWQSSWEALWFNPRKEYVDE